MSSNNDTKALSLCDNHVSLIFITLPFSRVPHMRNTNMHGKISAKTERLVVNCCYYHYSAVSLSNKPKNLTRNHR